MLKRPVNFTHLIAMATAFFMTPISSVAANALSHEVTRGKTQVTACSKRGNFKCVTARTKETRLGRKYLSPGGNWKWCSGDCKDQLRKDHVDFWYYQNHQ